MIIQIMNMYIQVYRIVKIWITNRMIISIEKYNKYNIINKAILKTSLRILILLPDIHMHK